MPQGDLYSLPVREAAGNFYMADVSGLKRNNQPNKSPCSDKFCTSIAQGIGDQRV